MNIQQIIEELEALRVSIGRHMMALDSMTPTEQSNAYLCDRARARKIIRMVDWLNK